MSAASWGLVAKRSSSGTPVSSRRSSSPAHSFGEVQAPVDQAVPGGRGEGEVYGDLAQIRSADRAGVLVGRGHRVGRRLRILRLVHDQDPVTVVKQVHGPGRRPLEHRLFVPHHTGQQMVQAVRAPLTDRFGQAPAILSDPLFVD
jgi:hypothetical protein